MTTMKHPHEETNAIQEDAYQPKPRHWDRTLTYVATCIGILGIGGAAIVVRAVEVMKAPDRMNAMEKLFEDKQKEQDARITTVERTCERVGQQLSDQKDQLNRIEDAVRRAPVAHWTAPKDTP